MTIKSEEYTGFLSSTLSLAASLSSTSYSFPSEFSTTMVVYPYDASTQNVSSSASILGVETIVSSKANQAKFIVYDSNNSTHKIMGINVNVDAGKIFQDDFETNTCVATDLNNTFSFSVEDYLQVVEDASYVTTTSVNWDPSGTEYEVYKYLDLGDDTYNYLFIDSS